MNWIEKNPPATKRDIEITSKELNITFPQEYINFLLEQNGGVPQPCTFLYNNTLSDVKLFFGCNTCEIFDMMEPKKLYQNNKWPLGFLPVAADSGDNLIGYIVNGENNKNTIYYWEITRSAIWDEKIWTNKHFCKIANSLQQFLTGLNWV